MIKSLNMEIKTILKMIEEEIKIIIIEKHFNKNNLKFVLEIYLIIQMKIESKVELFN